MQTAAASQHSRGCGTDAAIHRPHCPTPCGRAELLGPSTPGAQALLWSVDFLWKEWEALPPGGDMQAPVPGGEHELLATKENRGR